MIRYDQPVHLRLPVLLVKRLKALAKKHRCSLSQEIREVLAHSHPLLG